MKLRVPEHVRELIRGAHPHIKRKLRAALELIQSEPEAGKPLRDELLGLRSCRIGRSRIIYRVAKPGINDIVAIGPRKTIYEETFRLVKRQVDEYEGCTASDHRLNPAHRGNLATDGPGTRRI